MKILLVTDTYPPDVNGAAYFTGRLGEFLARKGHEVHVAAPALTGQDATALEHGLMVHRIRSLPVPFHAYFRFCLPWVAASRLRRMIGAEKPDVVHVQNHILLGRAAVKEARRAGVPLVGTNHFMPQNLVHFLHLPPSLEAKAIAWAWRQFAKVYAQVDCVTTPTQTAAGLLHEIGFSKNAQAISCGIDLSVFRPDLVGTGMREKFRIPSAAPVILYVGRLEAEKRLFTVLHAFSLLKRIQSRAVLVLVGVGTQRAALAEDASRLGIKDAVVFTDFVPNADMPNIFAMADIFVMASVAELQSIATMEAMASGLPVVAARALALPELVHDGENGYLFPPDDAARLTECLDRILRDPVLRENMRHKSLEIIRKHSSESTTRAFEDVYQQAIQMHGRV